MVGSFLQLEITGQGLGFQEAGWILNLLIWRYFRGPPLLLHLLYLPNSNTIINKAFALPPDLKVQHPSNIWYQTSLVTQMVKRLPTMQETQVQSLGWEGPLEKQMATHSSTIVWKIPWMEEPGRLQSMGLRRVGHDWATSLSLLFSRTRVEITNIFTCLPIWGGWQLWVHIL